MSTRVTREYLLKGLFLGLWLYAAVHAAVDSGGRPDRGLLWIVAGVLCGLSVSLSLATVIQIRRGLRPWRNWLAFPVLVLLESPSFVYGGVVGGLLIALLTGHPGLLGWIAGTDASPGLNGESAAQAEPPPAGLLPHAWLVYFAAGGLLLGYGFAKFRQTADRRWRLGLGLALAAAVIYVGIEYLNRLGGMDTPAARYWIAVYLLAGLPFFYLLTLCGETEESEVEIMAMSATLGVALHLLRVGELFPSGGGAVVLLVPLTIYFVYAVFLLPPLRLYKHLLRGYSYMHVGQLRTALEFLRRAQELDPNSRLAHDGLVQLHRRLTPEAIVADPALAAMVDYRLCLERAAALLMQPPSPLQIQEAERFLHLVESKQPSLQARIDYLRTLLHLHRKEFDVAAELLRRLLDPIAGDYDPRVRAETLFDAWELALRLHPQMVARIGERELDHPGRRMEAIAAVERVLTQQPDHAAARELKINLYPTLKEEEFLETRQRHGRLPRDFDYAYVEQLGLALIERPEAADRNRGRGFLRIAALGQPQRAPQIHFKLAESFEQSGESEQAEQALQAVVQTAESLGIHQLTPEQKQAYLESLRRLASRAEEKQDYDTAIAHLRRYLEAGGTIVLETYRKLAELYAQKGDPLNAVLMVETALTYAPDDADLLRKKDSYYYSLQPARLEQVKDKVARWLDVDYCLRKAAAALNAKEPSVELLEWAGHLAALAAIMQPQGNAVRLTQARVLLRRGQRDEAVKILEDIHYESDKGSGGEEEAWYQATKMLGYLYLDELGRPENAVHCFLKYKDYYKSGADTLFAIARCYEALGDVRRAVQYYKAVTGFEGHPLVWEAHDALRRLQQTPTS